MVRVVVTAGFTRKHASFDARAVITWPIPRIASGADIAAASLTACRARLATASDQL